MWIFKFLCFYFMTELVSPRPLPGFLHDYTIHEAVAATRTEYDQKRYPSPTLYGTAPKHSAFASDLQASDGCLKSSTYSTLYTSYTSEITHPNLYSYEYTPHKLPGIPQYIKANTDMPIFKSMMDSYEQDLDYATFDTSQLEELLNMLKKKNVDKRNNLKPSRIADNTAHHTKRRSSDEQKPSLTSNLKNMYKKVFQKVSTDFQNELNYTVSSFKEITGLYDTTTSKNGPSAVAEKVTEAPRIHKTTTTLATTSHTVTSDSSDMDNNENTDGQDKNDNTESFTSTTSESNTAPSSKDDTSSDAQEKTEESHDITKITTVLTTTQHQNATKQIKKDSTRQKKLTLNFNKLMLDNLTNSVLSRSDDVFNVVNLYENVISTTENTNEVSIYPTKRKRNLEILSDLKLNEDVFNDGEIISEASHDFSEDTLEPEPVTGTQVDIRMDNGGEPETTETLSLSTLSNNLAYNDYINGYKYYLNYQRELSKDRFSDLVKYQAHKHHKVDDIGKFILEKLPHVPDVSRKKKKINAIDSPETQDAFTKNDGSWFKKHFYLFIDSGSPKKFHSSQTVPMKTLETKPNTPTYDVGGIRYLAAKKDVLQVNNDQKYRSAYANSYFGSDSGSKDVPEIPIETTTHPRSSFVDFFHKIIDIQEDITTTSSLLLKEMNTEDIGKPKYKRETGKKNVRISQPRLLPRGACKHPEFKAMRLEPKKAINHAKKIKRVPLFSHFNFSQKHGKPRLSKPKRQVTQRNTRFIFKKWKNILKDKVPNSPTVAKAQGKSPLRIDNTSQLDMKFKNIKPEQYKVPNIDDLRVEVPNITFDNTYLFQQKDLKKFPSSSTYSSNLLSASSQTTHQLNPYYQDYTPKAKDPKGAFKVADPFTPEPFRPETSKNYPYKMPYSYKTQELDLPQTLNETMNEKSLENASESYGKPFTIAGGSYDNVDKSKSSPKTSSAASEQWLAKSDTTSKGPQTQWPERLDFEFTTKSHTQNIEPKPWSTRINLHRTNFPTTGVLNLLSGPQTPAPVRLDFEWTMKTGIKTDEPEPWSLTRINMQRTNTPAAGYLNLLAAPVSSNAVYTTKGLIFYDKVPAYEDVDQIADALEVLPNSAIAWESTKYVIPQKEQQHKKSKQFFTTPIPMKINEFDKYKVNEIDNYSNFDKKLALTEMPKLNNYQQLWANPTKIIKMNKMNTQNAVQKYRENTFDDDDEVTEVLVNVNTYDENDYSKDLGNKDQIDISKYKNILNENRLNETSVSQRTDTFYTKNDNDTNDLFDSIDFQNSAPSETYQTKHNKEHSGNIDWSSLSHRSNASKTIAENVRDMFKAVETIQKAHMFKDASHPNIITEPDIIIGAETPKPNKLKEKQINERLYERKKYPQMAKADKHSNIKMTKDMNINFPNLEAKPSSEKPRKVQISNHVYKFDIIYSNAQPEGHAEPDPKAPKEAKRDNALEKPNNVLEKPSYNIEQKDLSTVETIIYTPVYINLPTYYEPDTQLSDVEIVVTRKEVWHDHIMRCLSGLALVELLRKYGFNKIIDGDNSTDNVIINSNKVYRGRIVKRTAELVDQEQMRDRRFDGDTLKFWKKKTIKSTKLSSDGNNLLTSKTVNKATKIASNSKPFKINGALSYEPAEYDIGDNAGKTVKRFTKSLLDMLQSPFTKKTTAKQVNPLENTMVGNMIKEMENERKVNTLEKIEKQFKSKHANALSPYRPPTQTLLGTMGIIPNIPKNKVSFSDKAKKNVKRNVSVTQFTVKDVAQLDIVMDMEKKMVEVNDGKEKRDIQLVINSVSGSKKAKKQTDNVADGRTTAKMYVDPTSDTNASAKRLESKAIKINNILSPNDVLYQVGFPNKKIYANIEDSEFNTVSPTEIANGLYFIIQRGGKILLNPLLQNNLVVSTSPMPFTNVDTAPGFVLSPSFVASMEEKLSKIYNVLLDNGASQKLNESFRKKRNYNNETHCSNQTSELAKTDDLRRKSRKNYNLDVLGTVVGLPNVIKMATYNISENNTYDKTHIEDEFATVLPSNISTTSNDTNKVSPAPTANKKNTIDDSKIAENVNNAIEQLKGITANVLQNTMQISKSIIEFGNDLDKDFGLTEPLNTTKPTKATSVKIIEQPKTQKATTAPHKTTSVKIISPPNTEKSATAAPNISSVDVISEPNTQKSTTAATLVIVSDYENEHLAISMTPKNLITKPTTVNDNENSMENNKHRDIRPEFLQILANNLTEKKTTLCETQPELINLKVSNKITKKPSSLTNTGVKKKIVTKQNSKELKKATQKLGTKAVTKLQNTKKKTKQANSKT